jgi:hypothetical protein
MDRRSFLGTLVGGVACAAAVRTFPFRVFSFPSEILVRPRNLIQYGMLEQVAKPIYAIDDAEQWVQWVSPLWSRANI